MATSTQYNPNVFLNERLLKEGASKTVYALVTPETERAKHRLFGDIWSLERDRYHSMFRGAWTGKQDAYHEDFFNCWHNWSKPVIDLDRELYPFYYPTSGASEALRHIIYDFAVRNKGDVRAPVIHVFRGEYEGYKAMGQAAGVIVKEWERSNWRALIEYLEANIGFAHKVFISAPSAIDGNVWPDFNEFIGAVPMHRSVVVDVTYVGAIGEGFEKFNLNQPSIDSVVFSLSKPFGVYYDRIGGVFMRSEDEGLFGNKWFKNLTSLALGVVLMENFDVFYFHKRYKNIQEKNTSDLSKALGLELIPSDVFILAHGPENDSDLAQYLKRGDGIRICLTPGLATPGLVSTQ